MRRGKTFHRGNQEIMRPRRRITSAELRRLPRSGVASGRPLKHDHYILVMNRKGICNLMKFICLRFDSRVPVLRCLHEEYSLLV